jgi:hypothetical protein
MEKMRVLGNRRGDNLIYETVIFIVLNIIFFVVLLLFVGRATSGAGFLEQTYVKQIALIVDQAKPGMTVIFSMQDAVDLVKKLDKSKEGWANDKILAEVVKINQEENKVIVKIGSRGGHSFRYFSGYNVTSEFKGNQCYIMVKEASG